MNKLIFSKALNQMREFCLWLDRVEKAGLDIGNDYTDLADQTMHYLLGDGNLDWDYDEKEDRSWIIEYTGDADFPKKYKNYFRYGRYWDLSTAEGLYDFLICMNITQDGKLNGREYQG